MSRCHATWFDDSTLNRDGIVKHRRAQWLGHTSTLEHRRASEDDVNANHPPPCCFPTPSDPTLGEWNWSCQFFLLFCWQLNIQSEHERQKREKHGICLLCVSQTYLDFYLENRYCTFNQLIVTRIESRPLSQWILADCLRIEIVLW